MRKRTLMFLAFILLALTLLALILNGRGEKISMKWPGPPSYSGQQFDNSSGMVRNRNWHVTTKHDGANLLLALTITQYQKGYRDQLTEQEILSYAAVMPNTIIDRDIRRKYGDSSWPCRDITYQYEGRWQRRVIVLIDDAVCDISVGPGSSKEIVTSQWCNDFVDSLSIK